jgi:hypothetical protein
MPPVGLKRADEDLTHITLHGQCCGLGELSREKAPLRNRNGHWVLTFYVLIDKEGTIRVSRLEEPCQIMDMLLGMLGVWGVWVTSGSVRRVRPRWLQVWLCAICSDGERG